MKKIANHLRNFILFKLIYVWVRYKNNMHCQFSAKFAPRKKIDFGSNIGIGYNCLFQCDITVGNNVMIGSNSAFINSDDHNYKIIGKLMWESGRGDKFNIKVDDDVWIGHGAIIMSPTIIGRGAIIAAGSLVLSDVMPYSIVGGIPARVLKMRFTDSEIFEHETLLINRKVISNKDRTVIKSR